jgi:DNA-binding protein H-NS
MDLAAMSLGELKKLNSAIEKEMQGRQKQQRNKAMEEIKSVAAKYGMKLSEVIGGVGAVGGAVETKKIRKSADKSAAKAKTILYRHPENSALTWSGGRGRVPQWVKDWKVSGRNIEEARITQVA